MGPSWGAREEWAHTRHMEKGVEKVEGTAEAWRGLGVEGLSERREDPDRVVQERQRDWEWGGARSRLKLRQADRG